MQQPKRWTEIDQRTDAERMQAFRRWQKWLNDKMNSDAIAREIRARNR